MANYKDGNWYFISKLVNNELNAGINYWWILIVSMLFSIVSFIVTYLSVILLPTDQSNVVKVLNSKGFHIGNERVIDQLSSRDFLRIEADHLLQHPE